MNEFEILVKDPRNDDEQSVVQITLSYSKGTFNSQRGYYLFVLPIKIINYGSYQTFSCEDLYGGCRLLIETTNRKSSKRMEEIFSVVSKNQKEIADIYIKSLEISDLHFRKYQQSKIFDYVDDKD